MDYIALGHIHKPQSLVKDKIAYCGALEPIDKNDVGQHGYIIGEITERGCKTRFVPNAKREYCHVEVEVTPDMTGFALREKIDRVIRENGQQNMYKIILTGFRDPEVRYDLSGMDVYGNIVEMSDETKPAYAFEKLLMQNEENLLGSYIKSFLGAEENSVEYQALCLGLRALIDTRAE